MRSHHKLVLLIFSLLAILEERILTEASVAQRRDSEKLVSSLKSDFKVEARSRVEEGRYIELTPVSSPLAATTEQMLTLAGTLLGLLGLVTYPQLVSNRRWGEGPVWLKNRPERNYNKRVSGVKRKQKCINLWTCYLSKIDVENLFHPVEALWRRHTDKDQLTWVGEGRPELEFQVYDSGF